MNKFKLAILKTTIVLKGIKCRRTVIYKEGYKLVLPEVIL